MKTFRQTADHPVSLPLSADEIVEFHLARILLLLRHCGRSNRIAGLTKFAKLDFFARYPEFFDTARKVVDPEQASRARNDGEALPVESSMVRHHYGPWDKRYYSILAHLSSKGLIEVQKSRNTYNIELTPEGRRLADELTKDDAFRVLTAHMKNVGRVFGGRNGTFLKNLIYRTFEEEVADRALGESIEP